MSALDTIPRIYQLRVKNYRALRDLELKELTPFTVFIGPNGSGKSTIFDVFAFLSEAFNVSLRSAFERRNRLRELRSRGADGPITIEVKYREMRNSPLITYHLEVAEDGPNPIVRAEYLAWTRGSRGRPFRFLDFVNGSGNVISGETPDIEAERIPETLSSSDLLAVNTFGQFASHPRVRALREFITGWYLSYISAAGTRGLPESGPQPRLSATGDNLPNVIQYLLEQHPDRLDEIVTTLSRRVPRLDRVEAETLQDGRLLLLVKDAPFDTPILSKFASDGTLKLLAYLTVLYDPDPAPFIGIEEPENQLHPLLLHGLAEECRQASARSQLFVTTHSPEFLDGLRPEEVRILHRAGDGYTRARRAADLPEIQAHASEGATLGDLWTEGFFSPTEELSAS
jgi:predicted ATPase